MYKSSCQKSKASATQLFGDSLKEEAKAMGEKTPQMTQEPRAASFLGKGDMSHILMTHVYKALH